MKNLFLTVMLIIVFILGKSNAQDTTPIFGQVAAFTVADNMDYSLQSLLSPTGKYTVAISFHPIPNRDAYANIVPQPAEILLWDTTTIFSETKVSRNGVLQPQPNYRKSIVIETLGAFLGLAFSSDERFLAVYLPDELLVLQLPTLEIKQALPIAESGSYDIEWSDDGTEIFALLPSAFQVLIWNIKTGGVRYTQLNENYVVFYRNQDVWILNPARERIYSFAICSYGFETCKEYQDETGVFSVFPNKSGFVTSNDLIWTREDGISFHSAEWASDATFYGCCLFNPTTTYFQAREGDKRGIWDFATLEKIQAIPSFQIVWLNLEGYFVGFRPDISLFKVGVEVPIDSFPIDDLSDIENRVDFEAIRLMTDIKSRYVLVSLGGVIIWLEIVE